MNKAIFACIAFGAAALSQAVNISYISGGAGLGIDYVYNSVNKSGFAGQLRFKNNTTNTNFTSYCFDLDNTISDGQTYNVDFILTGTLGEPQKTAGSIAANSFFTANNNSKAAALQIAIWAKLYGLDLATNTGGTFQLQNTWYTNNASIIALAQSYTILGENNFKNAFYLKPDPLNAGQGQVTVVPEPATMAALGLGVAALLRRRRK